MRAKIYGAGEMRNEIKATVKDTVAFMLHLFAWYLRDELGWGHDRIDRALKWLDERAGKYMSADGEVRLSDVHELLRREVGIEISFDRERMR